MWDISSFFLLLLSCSWGGNFGSHHQELQFFKTQYIKQNLALVRPFLYCSCQSVKLACFLKKKKKKQARKGTSIAVFVFCLELNESV